MDLEGCVRQYSQWKPFLLACPAPGPNQAPMIWEIRLKHETHTYYQNRSGGHKSFVVTDEVALRQQTAKGDRRLLVYIIVPGWFAQQAVACF